MPKLLYEHRRAKCRGQAKGAASCCLSSFDHHEKFSATSSMKKTSHSSASEKDMQQYVVQIRYREDPTTDSWEPSNEEEVDSEQLFISEPLQTVEYELLQMKSLSSAYSIHFITIGICGSTNEQIVSDREDESNSHLSR